MIGLGRLGYEHNPTLGMDLVLKNPGIDRGSGYFFAFLIHQNNRAHFPAVSDRYSRLLEQAAECGNPSAVPMVLHSLAASHRYKPYGENPELAAALLDRLVRENRINQTEAREYEKHLAELASESAEIVRLLEQEKQQVSANAERAIRPLINALQNYTISRGNPPRAPDSYSNASARLYRQNIINWAKNRRNYLNEAVRFRNEVNSQFAALHDRNLPVHEEFRTARTKLDETLDYEFDQIDVVIDRHNRYVDNRDTQLSKDEFWRDFQRTVADSLPGG